MMKRYGAWAVSLVFKGGLAVFARAVMMLAEKKVPLSRDVIFLAEADEEGGRYGTLWLAQNHWSKIDCEFALNEGGWILKRPDGRVRYVSISTADKGAVSLVLSARGTSTHSSLPRPDNAIFRLSKALARLADHDTERSRGHAVALPGRHRCLRVEEPGSSRVRDLPLPHR